MFRMSILFSLTLVLIIPLAYAGKSSSNGPLSQELVSWNKEMKNRESYEEWQKKILGCAVEMIEKDQGEQHLSVRIGASYLQKLKDISSSNNTDYSQLEPIYEECKSNNKTFREYAKNRINSETLTSDQIEKMSLDSNVERVLKDALEGDLSCSHLQTQGLSMAILIGGAIGHFSFVCTTPLGRKIKYSGYYYGLARGLALDGGWHVPNDNTYMDFPINQNIRDQVITFKRKGGGAFWGVGYDSFSEGKSTANVAYSSSTTTQMSDRLSRIGATLHDAYHHSTFGFFAGYVSGKNKIKITTETKQASDFEQLIKDLGLNR